MLTALPDHTAPPCSFLLGRAALSAASAGLDSVPYPGCDGVGDRAVYISLAPKERKREHELQDRLASFITHASLYDCLRITRASHASLC